MIFKIFDFQIPDSVNPEKAVMSEKADGYAPSVGTVAAREAVSAYVEQFFKYKPKITDIALANGASGALEFAISSLAGAGQNILVPA